MKALRLGDPNPLPATIDPEVAQPTPGPGELLIRVRTAGVTPSEILWYPTTHAKAGGPRTRAIPGHEFSGVVAAVGTGATGFTVGQDVYGMNDWFADGAMANYCITRPEWIAAKPARLTHVEAASVPIGALTAWQGLIDRAKLKTGERVLIHGGSGAVGVFAVQLARKQGAHVIASASAANLPLLRQLGAEVTIDYRATRFEDIAQNVDVIFDTVGGETLRRSWNVLRPSGRLITIAASEQPPDERTKQAFFLVEPSQTQLVMISSLLDAGGLRPVIDAMIPLAQASQAYAGEFKPRRGCGKMVVVIDPPTA